MGENIPEGERLRLDREFWIQYHKYFQRMAKIKARKFTVVPVGNYIPPATGALIYPRTRSPPLSVV